MLYLGISSYFKMIFYWFLELSQQVAPLIWRGCFDFGAIFCVLFSSCCLEIAFRIVGVVTIVVLVDGGTVTCRTCLRSIFEVIASI